MSLLSFDITAQKTNALLRTYRKTGVLNGNKWVATSWLPAFITGGIVNSFTKGNMKLEDEVDFLIQKGFQPQFQNQTSQNVDLRKVIGGAILAGTLGAFLGATPSQQEITITFIKK